MVDDKYQHRTIERMKMISNLLAKAVAYGNGRRNVTGQYQKIREFQPYAEVFAGAVLFKDGPAFHHATRYGMYLARHMIEEADNWPLVKANFMVLLQEQFNRMVFTDDNKDHLGIVLDRLNAKDRTLYEEYCRSWSRDTDQMPGSMPLTIGEIKKSIKQKKLDKLIGRGSTRTPDDWTGTE